MERLRRIITLALGLLLFGVVVLQAQKASSGKITVVAGTYGGNCNQQRGNKTEFLAKVCDGQSTCDYKVEVSVIGDPVVGCRKDYVADWRCGTSNVIRRATAAPEAGFGSVVHLSCIGSSGLVGGTLLLNNGGRPNPQPTTRSSGGGSGPPPGFTPCGRNSAGSGDTWPCEGPAGTVVWLVLHKSLKNAPVRMFFDRNTSYCSGLSVEVPLNAVGGLNYNAAAPAQLCAGNAPHIFWVGFIDAAGRVYPAQGKFGMTGCR